MKPRILFILLVLFVLSSSPAIAQDASRFIVRDPGGLTSLQNLCLLLGCTVSGGLDGTLGNLFLVTAPTTVDPNVFLQTLRSQPEIVNAELDTKLKVAQTSGFAIPSGLWDSAPFNYFGTMVWHGYVSQPAIQIIRLTETQTTFNATGAGIVAVIDTGIDPTHPVLQPVLEPGYDFTRNVDGGSEVNDLNQPITHTGASPAQVNQSTMAVLDQSTAITVSSSQYAAFGHGTMVAGVIHLVAPTARIMPLKAFQADGSGYTSDVLRAIYWAVKHDAKVINMSFSFSSYSQEVATAITYATRKRLICVASAGNNGNQEFVYPAALANVMGIASTTNDDTRSTFSNCGPELVWVAAPGEGIITTYPFGTYAAAWGTSFSAPFASGAVALLVSTSVNCNQYFADQALAQAQWISQDLGNGRLDLYQALLAFRQALGLN